MAANRAWYSARYWARETCCGGAAAGAEAGGAARLGGAAAIAGAAAAAIKAVIVRKRVGTSNLPQIFLEQRKNGPPIQLGAIGVDGPSVASGSLPAHEFFAPAKVQAPELAA